MMTLDVARQRARDHPEAWHIIYSPDGRYAYYCDSGSRHADLPRSECPFVTGPRAHDEYQHFLVATVEDLLRPAPSSHSTWEVTA